MPSSRQELEYFLNAFEAYVWMIETVANEYETNRPAEADHMRGQVEGLRLAMSVIQRRYDERVDGVAQV